MGFPRHPDRRPVVVTGASAGIGAYQHVNTEILANAPVTTTIMVSDSGSSRKANPVPEIVGLHIIPALIILLREIIVSGLREYLAPLNVSVPVSAMAKWKTTLQLVALGALILGGAVPQTPWVHEFGIICLWMAAALTLVTGYDYLRIGIKHMD